MSFLGEQWQSCWHLGSIRWRHHSSNQRRSFHGNHSSTRNQHDQGRRTHPRFGRWKVCCWYQIQRAGLKKNRIWNAKGLIVNVYRYALHFCFELHAEAKKKSWSGSTLCFFIVNLSFYLWEWSSKPRQLGLTSNGGCRREEKSRKHWSLFTKLLSLVTANLFFY